MNSIDNDAIILGMLVSILALIFYTASSQSRALRKFYTFVPPLLLCYFIPALLHWPLGWIDPQKSQLYPVARDYLLPTALVLLCLGIDIKALLNLGKKALIMFLSAALGIVLGGPIALLAIGCFAPSLISIPSEELWKGLATIAGSWIGGGANQTAMKEIFQVQENVFASMIVVDILVANLWMGILLYGSSRSHKIDRWLGADPTSLEQLKQKLESFSASIARIPTTLDWFKILGLGFGGLGLSHAIAQGVLPGLKERKEIIEALNLTSLLSPFFWIVISATSIGLLLSFTKAKNLEGAGASKLGSVFIYVLVATIGMQINLKDLGENLGLFALGLLWMLVHIGFLLVTAKLIKAPFFFVAVGSQANVGGAASAPIMASAFSPSLAPVGVIMAVLGYALGTYGALICAYLMAYVAGLLG
jgi:uncharacterized membrane protein